MRKGGPGVGDDRTGVLRSEASFGGTVPPAGVNAFFGRWPGDERDDELLTALEAMVPRHHSLVHKDSARLGRDA